MRRTALVLVVIACLGASGPRTAQAKSPKPTAAVVNLRKETAKTVRAVGLDIQRAASVLLKQLKGVAKQVTTGTVPPAVAVETATDHLVAYFDTTLDSVHGGTDSMITLHESLCASAGADDRVCGELELSACGAGQALYQGNLTNLAAIRTGAQRAWAPFGQAADCVGEPVHFDCPGPSASIPPHVVAAAYRGKVDSGFARLSEFMANIATCTGNATIVLREGYRSSSGNIYVLDHENKVIRTIPVSSTPTSTTTTIEIGGLPPGTYRYNDYQGSGNGGCVTVPEWEKAPPVPVCPAAPTLTFTLDGQTVTTPAVASLDIRVDDATGRIKSVSFKTGTGYPSVSCSSNDVIIGTDDVFLSAATPSEVTLAQLTVIYRETATSQSQSTNNGTLKVSGLASVVNAPNGCVTLTWTGGDLHGVASTFKLVVPVANVQVTRN